MIVADTSAIYALLNSKDQHHEAMLRLFQQETRIYITASITAEIAYLLEKRVGQHATLSFIQFIQSGAVIVIWDDTHLVRIAELVDTYKDLPLGYCDAAVITLAEEKGGRVATADRRHFDVVKTPSPLTILPDYGQLN